MSLRDQLNSSFKNGLLSGDAVGWHKDFLATGIPMVDHALDGGFGYGSCSEVFGNYSTGKTVVGYLCLIQNSKKGGVSILAESEGAYNPDFYRSLGGNPDQLQLLPRESSRTVEGVFNAVDKIAEVMIKAKDKSDRTPCCIVWDGIAATGTEHLQEVGMDKRDMSKANAMSTGCSLIGNKIEQARIAFIATNQVREMIGSMDSATHTPGGKAWPFLCSQRLELSFDGGSKGSLITARDAPDIAIGRWIKGNVVKNKLGVPWRKFTLSFYVEEGHWHPTYEYGTKLGLCLEESMFYHYLKFRYLPPSKVPIITSPSNGWYQLSEEFFPGEPKFRESEWPTYWQKHERLRTMKFEEVKAETNGAA